MTPDLALLLFTTATLSIGLGVFSSPMRRLPLSEPLVALAAGVVLGPQLLRWLDVERWGDERAILGLAAELTLAVGLMAVALRIPKGHLHRSWRSVAVLLALGMPLMWLAASAVVALTLGVPILAALLVGAVLTPTDPVIASTIVTGRVAEANLPARLRHLVSAESGLNDGLALPFVALPLVLLTAGPQALPGEAVNVLLWQVGGATIGGLLIGGLGGWLLHWADSRHTIEKTSFLAYSLALSLVTLGALQFLGMHALLGVFLAGVGMNLKISGHERLEEENVQEAVNRFFSVPVFLLLGLALPWADWLALGPAALVALLGVLAVRRLPVLLLLGRLIEDVRSRDDTLFVGWFGPIGVAAVFYASRLAETPGLELVWPLTTLVIVGSIIAHGVTATALTQLYGSRNGADQKA